MESHRKFKWQEYGEGDGGVEILWRSCITTETLSGVQDVDNGWMGGWRCLDFIYLLYFPL